MKLNESDFIIFKLAKKNDEYRLTLLNRYKKLSFDELNYDPKSISFKLRLTEKGELYQILISK